MTNHRCRQHGMLSASQCDNILYSGLRCSNPVCLECTDYYESVNDTKKYCYDCVISYRKCKHKPIPRVIPNSQSVPMKQTTIDLTMHSSHSNTSDEEEDSISNQRASAITIPLYKEVSTPSAFHKDQCTAVTTSISESIRQDVASKSNVSDNDSICRQLFKPRENSTCYGIVMDSNDFSMRTLTSNKKSSISKRFINQDDDYSESNGSHDSEESVSPNSPDAAHVNPYNSVTTIVPLNNMEQIGHTTGKSMPIMPLIGTSLKLFLMN